EIEHVAVEEGELAVELAHHVLRAAAHDDEVGPQDAEQRPEEPAQEREDHGVLFGDVQRRAVGRFHVPALPQDVVQIVLPQERQRAPGPVAHGVRGRDRLPLPVLQHVEQLVALRLVAIEGDVPLGGQAHPDGDQGDESTDHRQRGQDALERRAFGHVGEYPERHPHDRAGGERREQRPEVTQQVCRALDEHELLPLLVRDVILLGYPEQLLPQEEDVAVEHRIRLRLHGACGRDAGYAVVSPALRALHQSSGKFLLQLIRRPALTGHADGHGCLRSGSFQMYVLTSGPSWGDSARPGRRTPMRRVPALFLMLAAATTAWPQSPQATQPAAPVFIRVGRLIDGRSDAAQSGVGILIEGDRIKAVGPLAQVQGQAKGARVIDLSQMTVLPGLIDTHTHLLLQGDPTAESYNDQLLYQSTPYRAILAARNARIALEHGFTTIRDLETEGAMYADVDVKHAVDRGEIPGPRIFASTRAMAPTRMYPIVSDNWELEVPHGVQPVDGVEGARLAVRQQVAHGADWIKFYADRRYYFGTDSVLHSWVNFTDEEARAIVDEAHRLGRRVAAHAIGADGIAAALRAGVN